MGFPQVMAFDLLGVPASKRVYAAAAGCATALFMDGVSMAMEGGGAYNVGVEEAKTISSWLLVTFGSVLFAALVLDGASGGHQEL
ncbi:hypothetical protein DFJ74DRAFT_662932 [Hyaloraphidium curvatum]|nr:hypothetical protein DFJ74DRAFT_662932 [Hyaloraphidium curvatum]